MEACIDAAMESATMGDKGGQSDGRGIDGQVGTRVRNTDCA